MTGPKEMRRLVEAWLDGKVVKSKDGVWATTRTGGLGCHRNIIARRIVVGSTIIITSGYPGEETGHFPVHIAMDMGIPVFPWASISTGSRLLAELIQHTAADGKWTEVVRFLDVTGYDRIKVPRRKPRDIDRLAHLAQALAREEEDQAAADTIARWRRRRYTVDGDLKFAFRRILHACPAPEGVDVEAVLTTAQDLDRLAIQKWISGGEMPLRILDREVHVRAHLGRVETSTGYIMLADDARVIAQAISRRKDRTVKVRTTRTHSMTYDELRTRLRIDVVGGKVWIGCHAINISEATEVAKRLGIETA